MASKTPLFDEHVSLNAKMAEFAGWQVPMIYSSVSEEHKTVRSGCGIFDVSHMGEVFVEGEGAEEFIYKIASNDITKINSGSAQYSLLLNKKGGVVDDVIIYKYSNKKFLICLNASNVEKDFQHLIAAKKRFLKEDGKEVKSEVDIKNLSTSYSQIAIQGPDSEACLVSTLKDEVGQDLTNIKFFSFITTDSQNLGKLIIARTGYTGEDGFEVFLENDYARDDYARDLWQKLLKNSAKPIGFAARDTLRLEASLPLYGHELSDNMPALSSNVSWAVKLGKDYFLGRDSLKELKKSSLKHKIHGLRLTGKGVARESMPVFIANKGLSKKEELPAGEPAGWVTSGTKTPSLESAVAIAYLENERLGMLDDSDKTLFIESRGRLIEAEITKLPFYKRSK